MEVLNDLLEDVESQRNDKRSIYIENLLESLFECGAYDDLKKIENKFHCNISQTIEKHHQLQYTHYYSISSPLINGELHVEIQNGIDSGTELTSYSFDKSIEPDTRIIQILKDVEPDINQYKLRGLSIKKAKLIFPRYKEQILELHKNQSYDNYVTGGGTTVTDKYYQNKINELHDQKIFWKYIYEEIEVQPNLI